MTHYLKWINSLVGQVFGRPEVLILEIEVFGQALGEK